MENISFETPADLCSRLGLPFSSDIRLLTRALTHRSYVNEHPSVVSDNERLEFLGDAVLDFVVGAWVYEQYPEMSEGELTRLRSSLVRTETLAGFARDLHVGKAMRLGRGEIQSGGRDRDVLLCATFESIVGAIYQANDLDTAKGFILPFLKPMADGLLEKFQTIDPKSRLQEMTQSLGMGIPKYIVVESSGPEHSKVFKIEAHIQDKCFGIGEGSSKHIAQLFAATEALKTLENQ
jgi:ribonuclease-3